MQFQSNNSKKVILNITSLIDVVLLLLIFFMVSSQFIEQPGIKLDLPGTQNSQAEQSKELILSVTGDRKFFLDGKEIEYSDLSTILQNSISVATERKLTIKADEKINHGTVVEIMDMAKSSGVEKLVIATKVKEN